MLVSQSEYARKSGFSRQYVNKLVKKGVVRLIDGKIDTAQADAALEATREPARPQRRNSTTDDQPVKKTEPEPALARPPKQQPPVRSTKPSPAIDLPGKLPGDLPTMLLRARIKTELKRGNLLDIDEKVRTKQYVDADEIKVVAFNRGRVTRDRIMNLPDRLAATLAAQNDIGTVREILAKELRIALEGLANDPISD
jgi:hypothetical protein